jgi:putative PIN family toxin of toxin-antitoxin system
MSDLIRRVLFDANVWVSAALGPTSVPSQAIAYARQGIVRSIVSEALIDQTRRALIKLNFDPTRLPFLELEMRTISDLVAPTTVLTVITAKDSDNRVLECAVDGRADLIVTGDRKHLLPLGAYAGIPIVTPADFVASLAP